MAERGERTCAVCGKKYHYCNSCNHTDEKLRKETWRNIYCSENCRSIFKILSDHAFKHIDDKQAKERLEKCDLSKANSFREDLRNQIKMIQAVATSIIKEEVKKPEAKQEQKQNFNKNNDHKNNHKDIVKVNN